MATSTRASKNDHMTTLEFVFSLIARWIRSLTDMYSCSCLTPKKRIICENVRQIIYQVEVDDPDFWRCRIAYFAGKVIDVFYVKLHYFHKKQEWYFIDANLVLKIAQVLENIYKCEKYFVKTIYTSTTIWLFERCFSILFYKNFVKATFLSVPKTLLKSWIDKTYFRWNRSDFLVSWLFYEFRFTKV